MKGVLEFNLDDPFDEASYMRCVKAKDMAIALWDIDQYLRAHIKYAPDTADEKTLEVLEQVRDELHQIMSNYNIDLDELLK
jgi:hypothetical protein